jgi:8-oxo-dGTP pyrophosphatase MutT (NUDIX family)
MVWSPRVTVAAVVEREGRFLVVEEDVDGRRVINQPAGHLEEGEDLLAAARRETLEETGWYFEPEAIVGIYLYRNPHPARTYLRVCFCGRLKGSQADRALDPAIVRVAWHSRSELADRERDLRSPMVLRAIDDYLGGSRYPLSLLVTLREPRTYGGL